MRLNDDSELYQVNNVWLGPKGQQLPWRARYSAYGVGLIVFILALAFERRLGVPVGFMPMVLALLGTIIVTRYIMQVVSFERPVGTILSGFWHELTAPRRITKAKHATFSTKRIPIYSLKAQKGNPDA